MRQKGSSSTTSDQINLVSKIIKVIAKTLVLIVWDFRARAADHLGGSNADLSEPHHVPVLCLGI